MLVADNGVVESVSGSSRALIRYRWFVWLLALLPFMLLAIWWAANGGGDGSDDSGQYLMHAQALAEGRPYGDIGYIYSHYSPWIGPRLAPPGLPVTLAPLLAIFGPSMLLLRATMLLFSVAFLLLAGLYFARHDDLKLGLGVTLLSGLSIAVVSHATQILTDLPFAAIVWLLITVVDRPGVFSWKRIVGVAALGAYAFAFRPMGISLAFALLIFTAIRFKEHRLRPAAPVLIWLVGLLVLSIVKNIDQAALISLNPAAVFEWVFVERFFIEHFRQYLSSVASSHTYPLGSAFWNDAFHVLTFALMLVGLLVWLRTGYRRFSAAFAFSYFSLLLIMPLSQSRYLWPLYPILVFGLLNGIKVALGRFKPELSSVGALAFAAVLVPSAALRVASAPRTPDVMQMPEVREIVDYLRQRSPQDEPRVTFFKPRSLAWATGVPAMGPPVGPPICVLRELEQQEITHVIVGSMSGLRNSDLRKVINIWPERFVMEMGNSIFTVYRFQRGGARAVSGTEPDC